MKISALKRLLPAVVALLAAAAAFAAEPPQVTARVEPDSIRIGDRFDLVIEVERDLMQGVEFPYFTPRLESGLELVEVHPIDTLVREGRRIALRARYTMAAFEEGPLNLGPAQVLYFDKNILDTLRTRDSVRLFVETFAIDSTSHTIYDLKPQRTLPFRFGEVSGYLLWALLALVVLIALGWLAWRYLPRTVLGRVLRPAPPVPPHVEAFRALEALYGQQLWQKERPKAYYSGLTDILRRYLAGRYGFGALEMTSDEILRTLRGEGEEVPRKSLADLTDLLREADLVKFAKWQPDAAANEENYRRAWAFVEQTKPVEITPEEAEEAAEKPTEKP